MITAKAMHWVNYNGTWHKKGDVFLIDDGDASRMSKHAYLTESVPAQKQKETQPHESSRRGRKRNEQ